MMGDGALILLASFMPQRVLGAGIVLPAVVAAPVAFSRAPAALEPALDG